MMTAVCDIDPDEPIMEDSDDEFSDLEDDSDDDIDEEDRDTTHTPAVQVSPAFLGMKT